jgi:hypothetical protein
MVTQRVTANHRVIGLKVFMFRFQKKTGKKRKGVRSDPAVRSRHCYLL